MSGTVRSLLLAPPGLLAACLLASCGGGQTMAPEPAADAGRLARGISAACERDLAEARDARTFATLATRCLAEVDGWARAVRPIEQAYSQPAAAAAAIPPPPIVCSRPQDWQLIERAELGEDTDLILAGFVNAGDPTITLAPPTCLALERLLVERALPCLAEQETVCRSGSVEEAFALATLAHEAQHVAGVTDEATAECYAIQRVDEVARALGMAEEEAAAIGPFVRHAAVNPPEYRSPQCRAGGELDLEPETPAFP